MAKYKNREVTVLNTIPHPLGDQVVIEHKELSLGKEIVMKKDVIVSPEEKQAYDAANSKTANEFQIGVEVTPTGNTATIVKKK